MNVNHVKSLSGWMRTYIRPGLNMMKCIQSIFLKTVYTLTIVSKPFDSKGQVTHGCWGMPSYTIFGNFLRTHM